MTSQRGLTASTNTSKVSLPKPEAPPHNQRLHRITKGFILITYGSNLITYASNALLCIQCADMAPTHYYGSTNYHGYNVFLWGHLNPVAPTYNFGSHFYMRLQVVWMAPTYAYGSSLMTYGTNLERPKTIPTKTWKSFPPSLLHQSRREVGSIIFVL